jgi:hypothetical protein
MKLGFHFEFLHKVATFSASVVRKNCGEAFVEPEVVPPLLPKALFVCFVISLYSRLWNLSKSRLDYYGAILFEKLIL